MTLSPKPGDIVHVRAIVRRCANLDGDFILAFKNEAHFIGREVYVSASEILHIEPRPLQVGDMVEWQEHLHTFVDFRGKILAFNATNSVAWIEADPGDFHSINVSKLSAIP